MAILFAVSLSSCAADNQQTKTVMSLDEYLKQSEEKWFLTGKKRYTIKAMMVSEKISFRNEFELTDYTVEDDGETVVLKGTADEMWASKLEKVIATYTKPDGSSLSKDDFVPKDAYIDIVTIPSPDKYYAMFVPNDISVTVLTAWGDELHTNLSEVSHGKGDYLVCNKDSNGDPDLNDVWVLNGVLFDQNYDTSRRSSDLSLARILLYACSAFYALLCVFSIVTGLMYASGRRKLNPLELSDNFMNRFDSQSSIDRFAVRMGWVTFAVGIIQGLTAYALFNGKGLFSYLIALGFTVFSLTSVSFKLKGRKSLFAILKCLAYVLIIIILVYPGVRSYFFS